MSFKTTKLKLNPAKCQAIQVCFMRNPPPHLNLKMGPNPNFFVLSAKVLGTLLQNELKWELSDWFVQKCQQTALYASHPQEIWFWHIWVNYCLSWLHKTYNWVRRCHLPGLITYTKTISNSGEYSKKASKIMLDYEFVRYVNALEICSLDLLSTRWEIHCLNFARSLCAFSAKIWTHQNTNSPSRQEIHGMRNSTNITQLRARTNRFAQSPIHYYIGLLNSS